MSRKADAEKAVKNITKGMVKDLADLLLGERIPLDLLDGETVVVPASQKINITMVKKLVDAYNRDALDLAPSPIRNRVLMLLEQSKNVHTHREKIEALRNGNGPGMEM